jgi:hypothetical protein
VTDDEIVMVLRCAADLCGTDGPAGALMEAGCAFGDGALLSHVVAERGRSVGVNILPQGRARKRDALLEAAVRIEQGGEAMTLKLRSVSTATTYRFGGDDRLGGWACCTVNDATGELTITSDWGNWGHRWNTSHIGSPTLTHFIADRTACDYLACKLVPGDGRRFSAEKTTAELRRLIIERRRDPWVTRAPNVTKEQARELWDALGNLEDDCGDSCELYFERIPYDFTDLVCSEPWHYAQSEPTSEYTALVEIILPALVDACSAEVSRRAAMEAP